MATTIEIGEKVPDFRLQDEKGKEFHLSSHLSNGPLLLVFYPRDFTAVCTKQLCSYRDQWSEFEKLGVKIVGLSDDSSDRHSEFTGKFKFPFPLLTDTDKRLAKQLGCTSKFLFGAVSRAYVLVGKDGKLLHREVEPTPISHPNADKVLEVVRDFKQRGLL